MSTFLAAFVCAIVLAIIVLIFIAYCMFCKEKHKSERFQYDITDIRLANMELAQEQESKKEVTSGIFVLARKRHKEDYSYHKRPDYPEGPVTVVEPKMDNLIEILNDSSPGAESNKCVNFNLDNDVPYHSEV